mgnify:CR=1 FL=1|jgi:hypothetical protein
MGRAFNFIKIIFFFIAFVYLIGFAITDEFLRKFINEAGSKLAPYGIEILHLR